MAPATSYQLMALFHLGFFLMLLLPIAVGDAAPTACRIDFPLVKVKKWVNGDEKEPLFGLDAAFGSILPEELKQAQRLPANFLEPATGCTPSSSKALLHWYSVVIVTIRLRLKLPKREDQQHW